jgi:soluble lytic murein transglycosylase-like protein
VASAASSGETLPGVVPASYAGGTPSASAAIAMQTAPESAMSAALIHAPEDRVGPESVGARTPELDHLMAQYAQHYDIPEELVRRVAKRESTFNPKARNGPYWGLMQIRHDTAKGMGYKGTAAGLLDAETNLKYAVRYLRGAWLVAKGNLSIADRLYQRGYYYDAKRAGLLDETGLGKDRRRRMPQP